MAVTQFRDGQMKGEVQGPASSTDNAIARYDGTTGKTIQDSGITVDNSGNMTLPANANINMSGIPGKIDATTVEVAAQMKVNPAGVLTTDNIEENTSAAGVTIDSVLLKDGGVTLLDSGTLSMDNLNRAGISNAYLEFDHSSTGGFRITNEGPNQTLVEADEVETPAVTTNTVDEYTTGSGVTIDGVLIKDNDVSSTDPLSRLTISYADLLGKITVNTIDEFDPDTGVTVDGVLIKDGNVDGKDVSTLTSNSGDVVGPASSTDNAVALFDGTTGKIIQNSAVTVDNADNINTAGAFIGSGISLSGSVGIADGGTGASTASGARTNLGLGDLATQDAGNTSKENIGANAYFAAVQGTNQTLNTSIDWLTETRKDSVYTHSTGTNPDEITITEDGDYKIMIEAATGVSSGSARSISRLSLQIDYGAGFTDPATAGDMRGYMYNRLAGSGKTSCSITIIEPLTNGDKVRGYLDRIAGSDTIESLGDGTRIIIERV